MNLDMRIPITSPVGKWWVVAVSEGDLYVTDGDAPIATSGGSWRGMITNFFGPRLQTMCLEIVLFQPLRLIRAHYNLRLTNS